MINEKEIREKARNQQKQLGKFWLFIIVTILSLSCPVLLGLIVFIIVVKLIIDYSAKKNATEIKNALENEEE